MTVIRLDVWLAWYLIIGVLSFCVLYTLYAVLFTFKNQYEDRQDEVHWVWKGLFYFAFFIGYVGDVLWRWLYGTVLLAKLPMWQKDQTLTKLLNWVARNRGPETRTRKIADFIGIYLLNPFDEGHYDG